MSQPATPYSPLIPSREFIQRTSAPGKLFRSTELKELDAALARYETRKDAGSRQVVEMALRKWKVSKGPGDAWKENARNRKDRAFEQLTAMLSAAGDSDAARGEVPAFMHPQLVHARLGVLYLFAHMDADPNIFQVVLEGGLSVASAGLSFAGADVVDTGIGGLGGLGSEAAGAVGSAMGSVGVVVSAEVISNARDETQFERDPAKRSVYERVRDYFRDFIKQVIASIKEKLGDGEIYGAAAKNLVAVCMSAFASKAAPFVGAGFDIAKGVSQTLQASITRINTWKQGKGVEFLSGHPGVIVESIKRSMALSIGAGLYTTLKGVGKAAMTGLSAGISAIVDVVIAIAEMVVKVVWRLVEVSRMKTFFGKAKEHWQRRGEGGAIHTQPYAFESWYRKHALPLPAIPVLTLNSGICGDKMHFLKMFHDDPTSPISQEDFNRGVHFVDQLKGWGAGYLKSSGFRFSSEDRVVQGLLKLAQGHSGSLDDSGSKVFNHVLKFVAG
jgi:hypothetical protein